jgi:hypothetical protein
MSCWFACRNLRRLFASVLQIFRVAFVVADVVLGGGARHALGAPPGAVRCLNDVHGHRPSRAARYSFMFEKLRSSPRSASHAVESAIMAA